MRYKKKNINHFHHFYIVYYIIPSYLKNSLLYTLIYNLNLCLTDNDILVYHCFNSNHIKE